MLITKTSVAGIFDPPISPKSLMAGWGTLLLALLASAVLMRGVMKLSDRRATFVSSVTHELRTPLTTFHLYSDMLAEGMVKEEKRNIFLSLVKTRDFLSGGIQNIISSGDHIDVHAAHK